MKIPMYVHTIVSVIVLSLLGAHSILSAAGEETTALGGGTEAKSGAKPDEVTLVGMLKVSWNKKAQRTGQLIVNAGKGQTVVYNITRTLEGDRCMRSMKGKKVEITAILTQESGQKWLSVKKFREIKEPTAEKDVGQSLKKAKDSEDEITVTGVVKCVRDTDGKIRSGQLVEQNEKTIFWCVYNITVDPRGRRFLESMDGKQTKATGKLTFMRSKRWLTVKSYQEIKREVPETEKTGKQKGG